ncbi:protein ASPARTIC PROTEASE IN GUARD CELL 1 [Lotus japonicus]|uniref:protein ASPARTIC PROTEASE IN GUARD CELL 1 n=1 Tax=Lotus japonicus TaxID=34305 RepID=UPI00258AA34C|nr:protein ASPARTIC PROTEASE IN GUARD CELL 1 [Lotus japonicus]
MVLKIFPILLLLLLNSCTVEPISENHNHNCLSKNGSSLAAIKLPEPSSFNSVSSSEETGCSFSKSEKLGHSGVDDDDDDVEGEPFLATKQHKQSMKLHLRHQPMSKEAEAKNSVAEFAVRDLIRIQTLHRRVIEKKNQNTISRLQKAKEQSKKSYKPEVSPAEYFAGNSSNHLVATLASGVSLGSGEYFMDVFIGTPPKHFSLILDTGSDLNWIQCLPCYACFEQNGPYYDPKDSTSFKNITCHDPQCQLVSSPDPPYPCKAENQSCPYFYWYGDSSNTTGDFALETFTVNLTGNKPEMKLVENVMFGCGHWNRGLFHGAAGLLGLGRGPLSFSSQLKSLYGHSFSYCLVDRNSNSSSKLIFGEDNELLSHPNLNFTSFVGGKEKENQVDTFYYVQIKSVMVGGEVLEIPEETWDLSEDGGGGGGTIIDSGTTLTYFAEPAYGIIKEAFMRKIKGYSIVEGFPPLSPCYNVSGVEQMELPEFGILFADGAVWDFPVENYFIQIEPEEIVCLAILGTPRSALSIIGNYQQQNFHILYDMNKSRLGYAPMKCADV